MMKSDTSPLRVGVLFSATGLTRKVELTQLRAVRLATDEINSAGGLLGRELVTCEGDSQSDPRIAAQEAQRLLDSGVSTIFGCYMSSIRRAVLPLVERHKALLFYPTHYEGFEYSEHCIYSGAAPNQNSLLLGEYVLSRFGMRMYMVGSNYVFPYESNRIMRDYVQRSGGKIVQERYLALSHDPDDVERIITEIRRHAPVTIFSTTVGDTSTAFYRAYERAGFDRTVMPIVSLTTGEPELMAMDTSAGEGHITSAPYFAGIESEQNQRFVNRYRAVWGSDAPISASTEAAYLQVHLFAQAAMRAESFDPSAVRAALPGCSFDAPQGNVRIDGQTHHTYLWPRLGIANARGEFDLLYASAEPVAPDPYLIMPQPWRRSPRFVAV